MHVIGPGCSGSCLMKSSLRTSQTIAVLSCKTKEKSMKTLIINPISRGNKCPG